MILQSPIWDDAPWEGLPALDRDVDCDVAVVGIGGSGLAAVRELLDLGQRVVAVDAGAVAAGAAGRNGGFLLAGLAEFHHDAIALVGRARAVALYQRTLRELDRMTTETPAAIRRGGSLRVAASEEELDDCRAQLTVMREDGLPAEWYRGPEGEGLRFASDGVFQPVRRCRHMARHALERGAGLFERSPALEIGPGLVATPGGRIRAGAVIVAVDGGLERLLPELAGRVRTARLQMLATAPTDSRLTRHAVYSRWGYDYWQQLDDGAIALGGMRDRGGEAEWTTEAVPTEPVQALLEQHLRERLGVRAPVVRRWAGAVGYTETGLPVFEEVRPGVWAIGGYSGTGNVIGAICGRAVARLVATGRSEDRELFTR